MRPSQKSNRARGRGGRKTNGNVVNRVFESAGPEGKVRGTPQQIIDKYLSLARDAQTSGDRVTAENFLQHAEHYQRLLIEAVGARPERREGGFGDQDPADFDGDDYGDGEEDMAPAPAARPAQPEPRPAPATADAAEAPAPAEAPTPRRPAPEISGLTTIDSREEPDDNLLVDGQELAASQPQPRRRNRRRGRPQGGEEGEAPAETGTAAE